MIISSYTLSRVSILGKHTVPDSSGRLCRFQVLILWERKIQRVVVMADNTDAAAVDVQASVSLDLYTTKRVKKKTRGKTSRIYTGTCLNSPREKVR